MTARGKLNKNEIYNSISVLKTSSTTAKICYINMTQIHQMDDLEYL